jgi:hypothetical protein
MSSHGDSFNAIQLLRKLLTMILRSIQCSRLLEYYVQKEECSADIAEDHILDSQCHENLGCYGNLPVEG